ncbi:adenylate/guanylate cyclase domain-containing protein [Pseudahrensia aquimaris]|uniref:Adenylate/guanylate cyclase domain-containing protein n=1 Tax=Pseudahrensia aquimaris TaxID=744461 RepID=A0ABW3FHA0_9HYPH
MALLDPPPFLRSYANMFRRMRLEEKALADVNPHLAEALAEDKLEGQRLATRARTIALGIIFVVLPLLNPHPSVIIYLVAILFFIALGWLQLRYARVGQSNAELALIVLDLVLLTAIFTLPNPWRAEPFPLPYAFNFDTFQYFLIILATGTLAYSWRTVWTIGTFTAVLWLGATALVAFFGYRRPEMTEAINAALPNFPIVASELDPNSVRWPMRIQEVVVFTIVAGILAAKGFRSNRLLIRQGIIAGERANLSRYFPSSMVDTLASTDHDIGAVRSQQVAVLFADIVGFTKFAETAAPTEVMNLLRSYHQLVERAIFDNGGTLDKYLGDGVMATFGTPKTGEKDAENALKAARQIIVLSKSFSEAREAAGQSPLKVSVGVHYGPVILGDIGPERRLEFAVIGDTVNVAARIEAATRALGCSMAVSHDLMQQIEDAQTLQKDLERQKGVELRGRETPIDLWLGN